MASTVKELLSSKPYRILTATKQLTLAFGGLYLASTTVPAKPLLVWETEKGYPRYYIPTASLHSAVRSELETGHAALQNWHDDKRQQPTSRFQLELVESVKSDDSEAVIERLSVASKSTEWVRFTQGPLKDFIRFEKDDLDAWFENGAIFHGIKNPYKRIDTTPICAVVVVKVNGTVVAQSNVAVLLSETGLAETYYLPATSIKDWGMIEKSEKETYCPYKGIASYFHATVDGEQLKDLIWYYENPTHESAGVMGFVAFPRTEAVETTVDGVKI